MDLVTIMNRLNNTYISIDASGEIVESTEKDALTFYTDTEANNFINLKLNGQFIKYKVKNIFIEF